jgi:hypothetical protein
MDDTLAVSTGRVDRRLLKAQGVVNATRDALRRADAVIVDPGDTDRAAQFAGQALAPAAQAARRAALHRSDALLGRVLRKSVTNAPSAAPTAAAPDANLTPTIALGPGITRGTLSSPSTKRDAVVAITDLAPTILRALRTPIPDGMVGHPLTVTPGPLHLDRFATFNARSATQTSLYRPAIIVYLVLQGLLFFDHRDDDDRCAPPPIGPDRRAEPCRGAARHVPDRGRSPASPAHPPASPARRSPRWRSASAPCARGSGARASPLAALGWLLGLTVAIPVIDVVIGGRCTPRTLLRLRRPAAAGSTAGRTARSRSSAPRRCCCARSWSCSTAAP